MDSIYTLPVCKKQYKIAVCMASNREEIERLHFKNARKNCLTTIAVRPYLGAFQWERLGKM